MFSRTHVETIRSEPSKRRPLLWLVMHNEPTFLNTVAHFMHDLGLIPGTVKILSQIDLAVSGPVLF